jgi:hypothetical protein
MALLLIVLLILILCGGIGGPYVGAPWPHAYGLGNGGIGIVGIILIVLVVLLLTGRL